MTDNNIVLRKLQAFLAGFWLANGCWMVALLIGRREFGWAVACALLHVVGVSILASWADRK